MNETTVKGPRLDAHPTPLFTRAPDRTAAVQRVLIGARGSLAEARIRIGDGAGGTVEIRLAVGPDGKTVAWQLLTATTGSRETLSDVMRQVRLRLRRRGILLEGEDRNAAGGDTGQEVAR